MQYSGTRSPASQLTFGDCNDDNILFPWSIMIHTFGWGMTYACNNLEKSYHIFLFFSLSTIVKAKNNAF